MTHSDQPSEPQPIGEIMRELLNEDGTIVQDTEAEAERAQATRAELIERFANDPTDMTEQDKAALEAVGKTALQKQIEKQQKLQQNRDSNPE